MQSSSPTRISYPSTPVPPNRRYQNHNRNLSIHTHQPFPSSPLASPSSSKSSPVLSAQRRKSSYKAAFPLLLTHGGQVEEPQKAFLRERFKARCFERAKKDRESARRRASRGSVSGGSSDGDFEMDDEDMEEVVDDDIDIQDELFGRIIANADRRQKHSYRLSYTQDVGSSFDPDMEDVGRWEQYLRPATEAEPHNHKSDSTVTTTPKDLEDEELQAYIEEYNALADFEDLDHDTTEWNWSDLEEAEDPKPKHMTDLDPPSNMNADTDTNATGVEDGMDMS